MPSGLIALLDDVATIAKLAAASVDDMGAAAGRAGAKAAGVVIDDTAVTPRYVTGFLPERELPIIAKIAMGSIRNKLLIILPVALLLAAFAPSLIAPLLLVGGGYLAFEATEKILEAVTGDHHDEAELLETETAEELEARQVAGAVRTDFILSAEIMVIALSTLGESSLAMKAAALVVVAIAITIAVYGVVALIVKLDDIGLHLAARGSAAARGFGNALVKGVPYVLSSLSFIGTAAMLWVGGGIMLHSLEEMHIEDLPRLVHDGAHHVAEGFGYAVPVIEWIMNALAASVFGLIVGAAIVGLFHLRPRKKAEAGVPEEIV